MVYVYKKLVKAGIYYHLYEYKTPVLVGYTEGCRKERVLHGSGKEFSHGRFDSSVYRTRRNVKFLVQSNVDSDFVPVFITFTFKEDITEISIANGELSLFIKRLNYFVYGRNVRELKYIAVPEIQYKREKKFGKGVWHYHVIFFNLPYIVNIYDVLSSMWRNGYILVKSVNDEIRLINYISKYFTKATHEKRLCGKKAYFGSRSLLKPTVFWSVASLPGTLEISTALALNTSLFSKVYGKGSTEVKYSMYKIPVLPPVSELGAS